MLAAKKPSPTGVQVIWEVSTNDYRILRIRLASHSDSFATFAAIRRALVLRADTVDMISIYFWECGQIHPAILDHSPGQIVGLDERHVFGRHCFQSEVECR